jgi:hypothetical protein
MCLYVYRLAYIHMLMYTDMWICVYVYVYGCVCMCMDVFECVWMYAHACECMWMHVDICVCVLRMWMWMYVNIYICVCVWIHMHLCMCMCMHVGGWVRMDGYCVDEDVFGCGWVVVCTKARAWAWVYVFGDIVTCKWKCVYAYLPKRLRLGSCLRTTNKQLNWI